MARICGLAGIGLTETAEMRPFRMFKIVFTVAESCHLA